MSFYHIESTEDLTIHVLKADRVYGPGWTLSPEDTTRSEGGWVWHDSDAEFEASDQMREMEPFIVYQALIEAGLDPAKLPLTESDGEAWVQKPAHMGYRKGAVVTHDGATFTSRLDNNVWEPGTEHGHTWLRQAPEPEEPGGIAPWAIGVAYRPGDRVTHDGREWEAKIPHTSHNDWQPSPDAHAVWELVL